MATFPGSPPNPLGFKAELNLAGTWTDITPYVMLRDAVSISNMGRTDESGNITPGQLTMTLKNDGRFTPKNSSGAYFPNIVRNCQVRISVNATSRTGVASSPMNLNTGFETNVANWTAANSATIAQSAAQAHTGAGSMSLHGNGTIASPQAGSEKEPVSPGSLYVATAWYFNSAIWASGVGTQINWYDASNSFISSSFTFPGSLPAATWTQVTVTATAPPNAAFANVNAIISGTPAVGNIFFIDDASISAIGIAYSGFRFWGEVASWPPGYDISQRDVYVQVTASGIWRRISQASVPIGSCYWRYVNLLTGTSVPAAYWSMEDGSVGTANNGFVLSAGTGTNMVPTGTPSYAADGTSFVGSSALPQMNAARLAANVSSGATPTNNVLQFALSVPAAGDSSFSQYAGMDVAKMISTAATIKMVTVSLSSGSQLTISGYTSTAGGAAAFTGTITTKVNGVPVLVSVEITPSGGSINWAMRIIKPGAGAALDQVTGTRATSTITAVTQVQFNDQGRMQDTTIGQAGVWYVVPSLVTAAANLGGNAGELAATRFSRLCTESNIPATIIGSGGAAMGPQVSDTMSNVLQSIEDTDGGMLFETTSQFGLGYRTLASMQNQAAALTLSYTSGALGAPLTPTYDDQLVHNQVTVTNFDGYAVTAQLNSGAMSIAAPPNGVGQGYASAKTINANTHAQVSAIATQMLMEGTVDDVRYPTVVVSFLRTAAAAFFSSVPSLRIGDFFQISNLPAFLGGGTTKQLCWGYAERIGGNPEDWTITVNAIPELPFETTFNPGSFTVLQGAAGGVPQGSSVGSTVNGSQIGPGAVGGSTASVALSARSVGGATSFIAAATPYKWTFAVTGTPADNSYFTCTPDQALPIAVGDTFSNTSGLGSPFTVTSVDQVSATVTNVHYTPDASGVMSSGTVRGGTNGDSWVNTSAGNQVNQWSAGIWNSITWNAHNVITAGTITATEILAGTITAGLLAAGSVIAGKIAAGAIDGMTITGATIIADGASGEVLIYSGTPAIGNLIGSWSGAAGNDSAITGGGGNAYASGLEVHVGGLVLDNQGSPPTAVSAASTFYSSTAGRPRYLSSAGADDVIERNQVNVAQFTIGNSTTPTAISAVLSYKAAEASQSSGYTLEIWGNGGSNATSAATLTLQLYLDGVSWGSGFVFGTTVMNNAAGTAFAYHVQAMIAIVTSGVSGTAASSLNGEFKFGGNIQGNPGGTVWSTFSPCDMSTSSAIDTTANHTWDIRASWSTTTGGTGQALTTYITKIGRRM